MRILQINNVVNSGSTGRIAEQIGRKFTENDNESYIAHGSYAAHNDKKPVSESKLIKVGKEIDTYHHGIYTLLTDKHGLGSANATNKLLKKIDAINPDVLGLHNIHGYYLNFKILFEFIKLKRLPVIWTFHDCWPFTGHCAYFSGVGCEKWKNHCDKCPLTKIYPKALIDRSYKNFEDKQEAFTGVKNLKIITPSHWLRDLVKQSFLKEYPVEVIHNGIDLEMFKPMENIFDPKEKIVLGVASTWDKRKGLNDFIQLRNKIDSNIKIILIGLSSKHIKNLPEGIKGIERTENVEALVEWYNKASVFVNPTYVDNFPTTNIEALASGTPVITYKTGGSPEAVNSQTGQVVPKGDINALAKAITDISKDETLINLCRERAINAFNAKDRYEDYMKLYLDYQ